MRAPIGFDIADEYMHAPTDHPQFNESMYFNFVDGKSGFATLVRMGNRANEGHAEVTVLVYLPGGGAAFHFERADIKDNSAFASAGLRFEIVEPFKHSRVTMYALVFVTPMSTENRSSGSSKMQTSFVVGEPNSAPMENGSTTARL